MTRNAKGSEEKMNDAPTCGESIIKGLKEAIAWAERQETGARENTVQVPEVDVQRIRQRLGLGQNEFAAKFGVSTASVRNWEQHRRRPEASARILLAVIDRHPEVVEEVLKMAG
jgi:putative transcriptional regulator